METRHLHTTAQADLRKLCQDIDGRRVGSEGNRAATEYFEATVSAAGFATLTDEFNCIDWASDGVDLEVEGARFEAFTSPYSLGCDVSAALTVMSTIEELEAKELAETVLLLRGDLAREQLMPKNFPFYNPDRHRRIIGLLERKQPRAIVAATTRDLEMVGGLYPFPLFEDGDFDVPSVFVTEEEGARLAARAGNQATLESRARRIPSTGANVTASAGASRDRRVVLFAHIDSRMGTPGANDNASGVVVLLLLAELLTGYKGALGIEVVAMNGEDYYATPGQLLFLASNAGRFDQILLGINLDDVGYRKGRVAYSLYSCPADLSSAIRTVFSAYGELVEGEPWYQGDHGLFLANQVPSLAITGQLLGELMAEITHTPRDTADIVDVGRLVTLALALRRLLLTLDRQVASAGAGRKSAPKRNTRAGVFPAEPSLEPFCPHPSWSHRVP